MRLPFPLRKLAMELTEGGGHGTGFTLQRQRLLKTDEAEQQKNKNMISGNSILSD